MITFWGGLGDGLACGEDIQVRNLHCHFSLPVIPRFNPDWMVLGGQGSPDCAGCGRSPQQAGSLSRGCSSRTSPKEAPRTEAPDRRWRAHHPPSAQKQLCGVTNSLIRPEWRPIPGMEKKPIKNIFIKDIMYLLIKVQKSFIEYSCPK